MIKNEKKEKYVLSNLHGDRKPSKKPNLQTQPSDETRREFGCRLLLSRTCGVLIDLIAATDTVMDSTALLSVVGGAFLLSIILVASLCTYCWGHKQPNPVLGFGIPYRHMRPIRTMPELDLTRIPTGSQASYVNQKGEEGITIHVNHHESEDEPCDPPLSEYIVVLPDLPMPHSQSRAPSRASSLSSGDQYINVKDEKDDNVPEVIFDYVMHTDESDSDIPDYENYQNSPGHRKESYSLSRGSQSSDERDSSDYVNTDPNLQ
ncbi:Dynein axonemal intermediate chain 1 [Labeo rohita]|uniref:Dynein axonemal intermediate chain 1 n=1 Tax=Labeo rohita TaxID=84645 RepID=A0ABQ8MUB3_LABRO|nr:Dynein axonemal intermediate chain 1 [Labeo rohita]